MPPKKTVTTQKKSEVLEPFESPFIPKKHVRIQTAEGWKRSLLKRNSLRSKDSFRMKELPKVEEPQTSKQIKKSIPAKGKR